jgi:hypothetical protein
MCPRLLGDCTAVDLSQGMRCSYDPEALHLHSWQVPDFYISFV